MARISKNKLPISRARSEEERQAKLEAILAAALEVFVEKGFADARLDEVAARAGVAKGTIYLYFADKQTLFQELARSMLSPMIAHIEGFAASDVPFRTLYDDEGNKITAPHVVGRVFVGSMLSFEGYTDGRQKEVIDDLLSSGDPMAGRRG